MLWSATCGSKNVWLTIAQPGVLTTTTISTANSAMLLPERDQDGSGGRPTPQSAA